MASAFGGQQRRLVQSAHQDLVCPAGCNDRYGGVFFGFDNFWPQGGMNQAGLFFDAFALKPKEVVEQEAKPRFKGNLIKEMMATCETVEEALALTDRYSSVFHDPFPVVHRRHHR
jgi:hypothetical protein